MKLLLNNNYHLLFSPEPVTFMTTFKLHKSLLKLVLCGSAFDKQGNWETEQTSWQQIQDLDLSVSAFKAHVHACGAIIDSSELQVWWQGFTTPKPIPCAWLTSFSNWKSKSLSSLFHRVGVGNSIYLSGHWREVDLGSRRSMYSLPAPSS